MLAAPARERFPALAPPPLGRQSGWIDGTATEATMRWHCIAPMVLFLVLAGCGDGLKRVPVQGKLTARGTPVGNATIQFIPMDATKGEGGIAKSEHDGSFVLIGSRAGEKAIVPGKYKVRVSRLIGRDGSELPADAKQADYPDARESVPAPYSSIDSPLEASVPEAGGTVNVDIPVAVARPK
jgi:hypothetical protein